MLTLSEQVRVMVGDLAPLVARLEKAVDRLERVQPSNTPACLLAPPPTGRSGRVVLQWGETCAVPLVVAYDELLSGPFKTFLDCSIKIGGDVAQIAKIVEVTFKTQRAFLVAAAKSRKPTAEELPQLLEPTGKKIQEVIDFRESKRTSFLFNHLSAISESVSGLSWVAVEPAPAPYVKEMGDAAVFYTNRVLKDYREKDKTHVEWVQNWNNVFKELQAYIKQHHSTGVTWSPRGSSPLDNLKPASTAAPVSAPPAGGIPPPPPMIKLEPKTVVAADSSDNRGALLDSLNQGCDITSGLKKVDDSEKTHKNPALRNATAKPVSTIMPVPGVRSSSPFTGPTKSPRLCLEGKKWFVEYQNNQPDLAVTKTNMDHCVYMFRCENTIVQVKGKINSIIMDSCKKSSVVFDSLVSSMEIVNCQSCKMQVMQQVPTVTIEKTDGCQVYLSLDSLHTEIVSAKSTEMNIMIPKPDGEFAECPIPEQFKTVVNGTRLSTSCTEKAG